MNRTHHRTKGPAGSLHLPLCLFATLALAGCWTTRTPSDWRYDIKSDALIEGQPLPIGEGVKAAAELTSNTRISIDASTVESFDKLPAEIRNLYGPDPLPVAVPVIVSETLAHNRAIKVENYTLQMAEAQIPLEKGIYDLYVRFQAKAREAATQPSSALMPAGSTYNQDAESEIQQLLPSGGRISLSHNWNRDDQVFAFSTINPSIRHALTANITQPLLRGFGPAVTNVNIHIAQNDFKASSAEFEAQVQRQLGQALEAYWLLAYQVRSYDVRLISYMAALDLERINQIKADAGVLPPAEVLQAKARAASRLDAVIEQRQLVRDAEDRLKRLMFFQEGSPDWTREIRPEQALTWREIEIDEAALLDEAHASRPELRALEHRLDSAQLQRIKARDRMLPQLDLFASAGITGLGDKDSDALDALEDRDFDNYAAGVTFSVPLQNRQARYANVQAKSAQDRLMEQYLDQRDQVTFEVRQAARALRTARERIDAAKARIESEKANLESEQKRLEVGVSTSFEVLIYQETFAAAQEAYIRAIVEYNRSIISLETARGTLLKTYGVEITSPDLRPEPKDQIMPVGLN